MCTGQLVTYEKKKAFIIAYESTGKKKTYSGLKKHTDGTRPNQGPTLLITLDAPGDYEGGGTRFFPAKACDADDHAPEPFVVKPTRGCAVTFPPRIEHEGVTISAGSRHLVCIFPDLVPATKPAYEKERTRDLQRHAALVVFGRLKKQKT